MAKSEAAEEVQVPPTTEELLRRISTVEESVAIINLLLSQLSRRIEEKL